MRSYIFTEAEVECLLKWLRGEETPLLNMTLSRIRRFDRIKIHMKLMVLVLRKMEAEGRLMGRMRLPRSSSGASSGSGGRG